MAMYKNLECRRNGTDLTFESRRNGSRRNGSRRNGSGRNGSGRNGNTPCQNETKDSSNPDVEKKIVLFMHDLYCRSVLRSLYNL